MAQLQCLTSAVARRFPATKGVAKCAARTMIAVPLIVRVQGSSALLAHICARARTYAHAHTFTRTHRFLHSASKPDASEGAKREGAGRGGGGERERESDGGGEAWGGRLLWILGAGGLMVGGGIVGAAQYYGIPLNEIFGATPRAPPSAEQLEIPKPPSRENKHPLDNAPALKKWFVILKRVTFLTLIFTPLAVLTVIQSFGSKDGWLRGLYLRILVRALEIAGCSFMKFGQWLSMRPDLFPGDVIEALGQLRNDAPSHSFAHTKEAIETSFGRSMEEIFEEFAALPIASGSVAQVYRAVVRAEYALPGNDNRVVAVKVRHPHVVEETYYDTRLLFDFLDTCGQAILRTSQPFDKDAFNLALRRQVDLKWEAYNLQLFNWNFQDENIIKFPKVFPKLVSESVLTETWIDGTIVHDLFGGSDSGAMRRFTSETWKTKTRLATAIFDMNMKMFLRDNYIHGDLHGGNLMAADDGTLAVFDAGLTCALADDVAEPFGYFLHAICTGMSDKVTDKLILFNTVPREQLNVPLFSQDLRETMQLYIGEKDAMHAPGGGPIDMGMLVGSLLATMQRHGLVLRGDVAVTLMTMAISESLIRCLDPTFDVVANALPYFVRFRQWSASDTDLRHNVWEKEGQATNGGLPVDNYEDRRKYQISTLESR